MSGNQFLGIELRLDDVPKTQGLTYPLTLHPKNRVGTVTLYILTLYPNPRYPAAHVPAG